MEEEKDDLQSFGGFRVEEDADVEKALEEYKAADERLWSLTQKYLYPPEEVPYVGQRQLTFPNVAARDEYEEVRRLVNEAHERYEQVASERKRREQQES